MTTKFSRNRARVQPTPKVCKSPKPVPPIAPPTYVVKAAWSWSDTDIFFNQTTENVASHQIGNTGGSQVYPFTGTDDQGNSYSGSITLATLVGFTTFTAVISTGPFAGIVITGTIAAWDGTSPWSQGGSLNFSDGIGSGVWTMDVI